MTEFQLTSELLSFLERREQRLLSWGFYDVCFTAQEVEQALRQESPDLLLQEINSSSLSVAAHLQRMEIAALLVQVEPGEPFYRTRLAEGVRLMARLRQRFTPADWAVAPKLVSDIKIHLTPRRYPKRRLLPGAVWDALAPTCRSPRIQRAAFDALSRDGDRVLQFSAFQKDALPHILGRYSAEGISGSVVSAGTGAGKTKAFYIPALLGCLTELGQSAFTKVIAIYPRTILLADQLREALSEAIKLRPVVQQFGLRSLRMGALLADTARADWFTRQDKRGRSLVEDRNWRRVANGYVVPFVKSPIDRNAELIWRDDDRNNGRTRLFRAGAIEPDVLDGELAMTREELMNNPPDILFLSAEMLNREMGNPLWAKTFGIADSVQKPRLLLLDEVHAYEGLPGAQIAWVLRRWRFWAKLRNLHVVGLSATLKQAARHLANVAALPPNAVTVFRPNENDMDEEAMEYNLAIKGDPSSGAALLSSAIQTGMLMARLLTPRSAAPTPFSRAIKPEDFYARKVFGFTDNLDTVNRWFSDMHNAESQRLAQLRSPPDPSVIPSVQVARIREEGQSWDLPIQVGHRLQQSLVISRCTATDNSGGMAADLVIATSKLEVGFDDPEVGAILHYKRPVSMASFIQRKGRAGRRRGTRPLTVVVLSDYGQDRWAFQHVHRLFLPEIDDLQLPVRNPYVLRTQATYFLIDWLGRKVNATVGPFDFLSRPSNWHSNAQRQATEILEDLLMRGPRWTEFRREFFRLFSRPTAANEGTLSEADLDAILWDEPRPLLRHAVPSLLRRLQANWQWADPSRANDKPEDAGTFRPLPQYLPTATFSDLEIADVSVDWINPPYDKRDEILSVPHGLAESCPGHVSKRFSLRVNEAGYWNPLSSRLVGQKTVVGAREVFPDCIFLETVDGVQVYQPQSVPLTPRPPKIRDSSNGLWNWDNQLSTSGRSLDLPVLTMPRWRRVFAGCKAYLHRDGAEIHVLRYAKTADYDVRNDRGEVVHGSLQLQTDRNDQDALGSATTEAIGFGRTVDGLCFRLQPEHLAEIPSLPAEIRSRFRADYFRHRLTTDPAILARVNVFAAEMLWQSSIAMLTATALRQRITLQQAQTLLSNRVAAARHVADHIFGAQGTDDHGVDIDGRRTTELLALWGDASFVGEIQRLEKLLWEPLGSDFDDWVRHRYVATLAQAVRLAVVARLPDVAEDDLAVDVIWEKTDGVASTSIFLTELSSGGLGQVETIVRQLRADPDAFHEALEDALDYCPRAEAAGQLRAVVSKLHHARRHQETNNAIQTAFDLTRHARSYDEMEAARNALTDALNDEGFASGRAAVVSVVTNLLTSGSGSYTDRLFYLLNKDWDRCTRKLGVAIDARVFAYLSTRGELWRGALSWAFAQIGNGSLSAAQLYALSQRMLLEGCHDSCRDCLDQPNRYNRFGVPSRALTAIWLGLDVTEVDADVNGDWPKRAVDLLQKRGTVRVISDARQTVGIELPSLLAREIDVDYLLMPVSVTRVDQRDGRWATTLRIREAIQ
jgi:hypothetical protein